MGAVLTIGNYRNFTKLRVVCGKFNQYTFLLRKYTHAKNGAPINAVIAPTGNSDGEMTVLAARSAHTSNEPPRINDMGIKCL